MFEQPKPENSQNIETVDRDKRAEVLLRFLRSAENIDALHGKKIEEIFSDDEHKRVFLETLQPSEFIDLLNGLNGILRNEKKDEWGMTKKTVSLTGFLGTGYVAPRWEDKEGLLDNVLSSAKEMNRNQNSVEDIALLVSASINAIHAYPDANGRTSRLVHSLLVNELGKDGNKKLQEVLGEFGRDIVDINPGFISDEINKIIRNNAGVDDPQKNSFGIVGLWDRVNKIKFADTLPKKDQDLFLELFKTESSVTNSNNLFLAIFQYLSDNDRIADYMKQFPGRNRISVKLLAQDMTLEDFQQIYTNYRQLKVDYVHTLIDSIAHPDKEEYQIEHEGQKVSLKDYFKLKIRENIESWK